MISDEAVGIRVMLQPETIDPNSTVEDERVAWERAASEEALAHGAHDTEAIIAGVSCRWVDSDLAPADATVIVYTHGGGLTAGSSITHRAFASRLAVACRARVLLVDYRLLPEHPISAPIDDVVAVVEHVVSTGDVGADRLFLAGDSSGAALAIGTTRRLRDRGGPAIAGVISLSGAFDATLSGDSIDAGHDPQITRPALEHWQQIVAAGTDPADPELSPMFASLHDLPPTLLLVGSDEVWLSDSTRLAERMAAAGSSAAVEIYDGMWHVWPMYGAFPEAVEALKRIALFVSTSS